MSTQVEQSFIANFEAEVHVQYQQMGSKLRNTVRTKDNIVGATTTFQKVGKGIASTKARHGLVPVMNVDHTPVECVLQDYYAGDWVDRLDELKTNINEQQVVAKAGAYALGRKTDEMIINQLATSTNFAGSDTDELTKLKVLTAFEMQWARPTCRMTVSVLRWWVGNNGAICSISMNSPMRITSATKSFRGRVLKPNDGWVRFGSRIPAYRKSAVFAIAFGITRRRSAMESGPKSKPTSHGMETMPLTL